MIPPLSYFSLRSKIICLVSISVLTAVGLVGGINWLISRQSTAYQVTELLENAAHFASLQLKNTYEIMKNDAFVLSRLPPISGIIRSSRNGRFDPQEQTAGKLWKARLATIFSSLMRERPHYTQMRFIGIADKGKELVRVNRENDGAITVVDENKLQEKNMESYFHKTIKLRDREFYFSKLNYNREYGKIDLGLIPTVRIALPIYDDKQRLFGMIVINCNYEIFARPALLAMKPGQQIYIADKAGNYISRDLQGKISKVEIAGHYTHPAPEFIKEYAVNKNNADRQFSTGDLLGYRVPVNVFHSNADNTVSLFALIPRATLTVDANRLANRTAVISMGILIVALLSAAAFAGKITESISQITQTIQSFGSTAFKVQDLPISNNDEVGEMARAFQEMVERLDLANLEGAQLSAQFNSFIATSVDGVIVIDELGRMETVNPAILRMFGYEQDELVGKNVSILMPEPVRQNHDTYLKCYRETGRKKYLTSIRDEKAQSKNGTVFPIALAISEVVVQEKRIFLGMIRDMSDVRNAQAEIKQYADELERSNYELDQFAYVASHDLKAPLRVINNISGWLEEDLDDKLTEKDRKHLQLLRNRVQRMDKLLDDLLEYSRVGRGGEERNNEILTGTQLIEDILSLLSPPPTFTIDVAPEFAAIHITRMPLQQVLYNLINNAIKHHDRDNGRITLKVERIPGQLRFTVEDDGAGIPPEYQKKIFEMFSTLKPRDEVEGSGMGLAIVKKTVEYFGGKIEVSSGKERGAIFTFTWPDKEEKQMSGEAA